MIKLPEDFENRMKEMLGNEYEDFRASYDQEKRIGIRVNTLKISKEEFADKSGFEMSPVKWCDTGFEANGGEKYGRNALHDAGAFYMQEPSAMAVATALQSVVDLRGKKVLDLCAAPGGKSTQLASYMANEGVLISNEINRERALILSSNIERMGVRNCIVLNETPEKIAENFEEYFDAIVVDAPCSGEGMFRKDETAIKEWSLSNVAMCANRQRDILEEAVKTIAPGGYIAYSTCTFAPEEDEEQIVGFLQRHPDFTIVKVPVFDCFEHGRPEWINKEYMSDNSDDLKMCARLWPHKINGEGHFIAILKRDSSDDDTPVSKSKKNKNGFRNADKKTCELLENFIKDNVSGLEIDRSQTVCFGDSVYLIPEGFDISSKGLHIVRCGLHLGDIKKDRFEPSHSLAMALSFKEVKRSIDLNEEDALKFRHGEEIRTECENGWTLVCFAGVSLGWGKAVNQTIKNHYPKGLRIKY